MLGKNWEIVGTKCFCTFDTRYYGIYFKDFGHLYIKLKQLK